MMTMRPVAIEAKLVPQIFVASRCQKSRPRCNPGFPNRDWGIATDTGRRLSHGINSRFVGDREKGERTSPLESPTLGAKRIQRPVRP